VRTASCAAGLTLTKGQLTVGTKQLGFAKPN
jgi:hypothetical protein